MLEKHANNSNELIVWLFEYYIICTLHSHKSVRKETPFWGFRLFCCINNVRRLNCIIFCSNEVYFSVFFYLWKTNKNKQDTHGYNIIAFSILFDFDDKNSSSFWTNNEKAGNYDYETILLYVWKWQMWSVLRRLLFVELWSHF